jgi:hypothetical protein
MPLVGMQQVQANQPAAKQLFGKSQLLQKPVKRMASFGSSSHRYHCQYKGIVQVPVVHTTHTMENMR